MKNKLMVILSCIMLTCMAGICTIEVGPHGIVESEGLKVNVVESYAVAAPLVSGANSLRIVVNWKVTNIGNSPVFVLGAYKYIIDGNGRKFSPIFRHMDLPYNLQPMETKVFYTIYEVSSSVNLNTFRWGEFDYEGDGFDYLIELDLL